MRITREAGHVPASLFQDSLFMPAELARSAMSANFGGYYGCTNRNSFATIKVINGNRAKRFPDNPADMC
jgi:hypothetical protein